VSRTILTSMLDKVVQHQRMTPVADGSGASGGIPTPSTINVDVPAAIWPTSMMRESPFMRVDFVGTHAILTDRDLAAQPEDRISYDSKYYIVKGAGLYSMSTISSAQVYVMDTELRS